MPVVRYTSMFIVFFAVLTISSGLRSQVHWHIVHPNKIDTSYYDFSIACTDETCLAGVDQWNDSAFGTELFLQSTDGGILWNPIESHPPYTDGFAIFQQIDSLDAVAASQDGRWFLRTFDGWKSWRLDTSIHPVTVLGGGDSIYNTIYGLEFSNAAEGMVNIGFGVVYVNHRFG